MLLKTGQTSLSRILAVRMVVTAALVCLLLTLGFLIHFVSNKPQFREATLNANAATIALTLKSGRDPSKLAPYREHPEAYGFRVFDRRALVSRRVLSSANARWLPPIQRPQAAAVDPDRDGDHYVDPAAVGTDLLEGFSFSRPNPSHGGGAPVVAQLIRRIVSPDGGHYWIQIYMIGDPAWTGLPVLIDYLISHVFLPALFFIPALTIAMFLTTRSALKPLRRLSESAGRVGTSVARGQNLTPVPHQGMAWEFAEVAETINAILAKLDRSLHLQKQFTSDVAHELRTPLAVLLLEVSNLPTSPARERVKVDLKELGNLVHELLRFAQAEDVMASEAGEVDVANLARKVSEEAVVDAIAKRQLIEFSQGDGAAMVQGSGALVEIAIRNLVSNALKYSPPQTTVTVRIDPGPIVIVEDCGPGIPVEHREHVFERFWRMDEHVGNGAGVGLALVRRIAQLHDGGVRLEERPGGGARIVLDLSGAASRASRVVGAARDMALATA